MKRYIYLSAVTLIVTIFSCRTENSGSTVNETDRTTARELSELWDNFIREYNKPEINGLLTLLTDDFVYMPSFNTTVNGKESALGYFMNRKENQNSTLRSFTSHEIFTYPSSAYEIGILEISSVPSCGDQIITQQRLMLMYRKDPDGKWKFSRWMAQDGLAE